MSVVLKIAGDPAGVHALADWFADVKSALVDVDLELAYLAGDASLYLTGEAGNAFHGAIGTVRDRSGGLPGFLGDASAAFHAYANRLERGKRDFDSYREQAIERGLTVQGDTVLPPTSSAEVCSAEGVDAEWDAHMSRMRTYNDLSERVGKWWGELEAWIADNIVPLMARVEDFAPLSTAFEGLSFGNEDVAELVLSTADERLRRDLVDWRASAEAMQADADKFTKGLRSNNPALRAASEAANPKALREGVEALLHDVSHVSKLGKIIPVAGTVIEIVSAASDIANGEAGSSVVVEAFAGAGAGAATAAGIAAAGGPVGWVVGGAAAAAIVVGAGAKWAWESWVAVDVRESIDGWLYDGTSLWQGPRLAE